MIELEAALQALDTYRIRLKESGHVARAATVRACMEVLKRLARQKRPQNIPKIIPAD